jgi:trk system potassium uptake protein
VAAVTGDDARNLVVCSLARAEFDVPRTIARVVDPAHAWAFGPDLGVDVALDQADLLARLTLEEMSLGEVATLVKLRRGSSPSSRNGWRRDSRAVGRTIGELELPPTGVLLAVLRGEEVLPASAVPAAGRGRRGARRRARRRVAAAGGRARRRREAR